jgi:glycosyltransferase involved in cell wall biosynthesis
LEVATHDEKRPPDSPPPIDVLVATFNSAPTLEAALAAARRLLPVHRLIVVDRASTDGTQEIARRAGAEVYGDEVGLGYARNYALRLATTDPVLFLDSDVIITRPDFYARAWEEFAIPRTAAVVGMTVGHRFPYGFPLGLTMVGRQWALEAGIPDSVQSRETYFLQRAARRAGLKVRYVPDAMDHRGTYRAAPSWPEFQGAAIRSTSGMNPREPVYAFVVILLMHMNSGRPRDLVYTPIFYAKLLRGFLQPERWGRMDRRQVSL